MLDRRPYLYIVNNMTGCAIGISDYGFSCVIYATSENEAISWGKDVATEYARRFQAPYHPLAD